MFFSWVWFRDSHQKQIWSIDIMTDFMYVIHYIIFQAEVCFHMTSMYLYGIVYSVVTVGC